MKMVFDRKESKAMFYVDDIHIGTLKIKGEWKPVRAVEMGVQTPEAGVQLDVRCDNLRVRVPKESDKDP